MRKSRLLGAVCAVGFSFITLTIRKIVQTAGAVALVALFAGSASAELLNSGFESPDASDGDVPGTSDWTTFENVFTNNTAGPGFGPVSHADNAGTLEAGTQSLKTFGPFQGPPFNASGVFQDINSVVAGQAYELEAWAMNWIGDPFQSLGILSLQFYDGPNGTGTQLGSDINQFADTLGTPDFVDLSVIQDGAEASDWTRMAVSGIAPAGTQSARIVLAHIQTGCESGPCIVGSLYWDDVSLKAVPVPDPLGSIQQVVSNLDGLLPTGDKKDDHRIAKALKHLHKVLNPDYWDDADRVNNQKVFKEQKKAVKELMKVDNVDVSEYIGVLVAAAAHLASTAIEDAELSGGDPKDIGKAWKEMGKAEAEAEDGDYDKAIEHYRKAWKHAKKAV